MRSPFPSKKCYSLQLAATVVAILSLIFGIVGMGVLTMEVFSNENSLDNMTVADNTDDTTGETKDSVSDTITWLQIVQLLVSSLTVLFAIFVLIVAWIISKRGLLWPWLIFQPLFAFTGFISTGYYAVWYWLDRDITMGTVYSVATVWIAGIGFIFWWVIFSYDRELSENEKIDKKKEDHLNKDLDGLLPPEDANANNDNRETLSDQLAQEFP